MTDEDLQPLPVQSPEAKPFWEAATEEKLLIQKCSECGQHVWHPRTACPYCLSDELDWTQSEGNGHLYTYSVVHHPPTDAWEDKVPYTTAIVYLPPEDVYIFTQIIDVDPDEVQVGMDVSLTFDHITEDITLPKFTPAE
jgi:uncharacterized OB-fold protein